MEQVAERPGGVGVNRRTATLVEALVTDAQLLRLGVDRLENGCLLVDAGIDAEGGLEAGRRIAEICMGGLGRVRLAAGGAFARWPWQVDVYSHDPVLACLGSQYAGWSLVHGEGKGAFRALGSGAGRILARKEPLFAELPYHDESDTTSLVLEVDQRPPLALTEKVARDCGVDVEDLSLILTPTRSLAGTVQIVARVLEVALHKAHTLQFPLAQIIDGAGTAPLPPPAPDFISGMGRTNDAILYGGQVQLYVRGSDEDAQALAEQLPSRASRDYGRPFAEVFKHYQYDFFQIDPLLFSPAVVTVTCLDSGASFHAGQPDAAILDASFGSRR